MPFMSCGFPQLQHSDAPITAPWEQVPHSAVRILNASHAVK